MRPSLSFPDSVLFPLAAVFLSAGAWAFLLAALALLNIFSFLAGFLAILLLSHRFFSKAFLFSFSLQRSALPFLAVLAAALFLAQPPFTDVLVTGYTDAGALVQGAMHIARYGTLRYPEPLLSALPLDLRERVAFHYGRSSYFPYNAEDGWSTLPWYHFYSVFLSIFALFGGLQAALWAQPLVAVMGLAFLYGLLRFFLGEESSLASCVLLAASLPFLVFSRWHVSEMLLFALFSCIFYLVFLFMRQGIRLAGLLSGLALFLALCTKVEAFLAVPALLFIGAFLYQKKTPKCLETVFSWVLAVFLGVGYHLSFGVVYSWFSYRVLSKLPLLDVNMRFFQISAHPLLVLAASLTAAACVAALFALAAFFLKTFSGRISTGKAAFFLSLASLAIFFYFAVLIPLGFMLQLLLNPTVPYSFTGLSVYLSPLGLATGCLGVALLSFRKPYSFSWPFWLFGVSSLFFFVHNPLPPLHPSWARYFFSFALPFLSVGQAMALQEAAASLRIKHVFWLAVFALAAHELFISAPLFSLGSLRSDDLPFISQVASRLPENAAVVTFGFSSHSSFAFSLRSLYGIQTLALEENASPADLLSAAERLDAAGYSVFFINPPPSLEDYPGRLSLDFSFEHNCSDWGTGAAPPPAGEPVALRLPENLSHVSMAGSFYRFIPAN